VGWKSRKTEFALGGQCLGLAFTDDGQTLISYAGNPVNQLALWRVSEGTMRSSYAASPFENVSGTPGTPFAVDRQGNVAAVGPDNTIHLFDLTTGKERWAKKATEEWVKALALSPDGQLLASGAGFTDSAVLLWHVASGKEITRLQGHRAWVSALVFWPDG
jgi:WD40 repeat protein